MSRVGQNRIYAPYMTVNLVGFLQVIPYVSPYICITIYMYHRIYILYIYVWFWPTSNEVIIELARTTDEHGQD